MSYVRHPVIQKNLDGTVVARHPSIYQAAKAISTDAYPGHYAGNISNSCMNGLPSYGFFWETDHDALQAAGNER